MYFAFSETLLTVRKNNFETTNWTINVIFKKFKHYLKSTCKSIVFQIVFTFKSGVSCKITISKSSSGTNYVTREVYINQ